MHSSLFVLTHSLCSNVSLGPDSFLLTYRYRLKELSEFLKLLADTTISLEAKMLRRL